jgi:hypothetical protein
MLAKGCQKSIFSFTLKLIYDKSSRYETHRRQKGFLPLASWRSGTTRKELSKGKNI